MNSTSETGHYKNVAEFARLAKVVDTIGNYNPTRTELQVINLNMLAQNADALMDNLKTAETALKGFTHQRLQGFEGLQVLATRICNSLAAANSQSAVLPAAKEHLDKLRGTRRTDQPKAAENGATPPASISVSQQSYDALADHFKGLVKAAKAEPAYQPNEADLTLAALEQKAQELVLLNTHTSDSATIVQKLKLQRDELLYKEPNGLVPVALAVKTYLKGAFGAHAAELKLVSALHFTDLSR